MAREIIDLTHLDGLDSTTFDKPARLVLPNPRHGGPSLFAVRAQLTGRRYRLSATEARIFVDVDPGEPEERLLALETIVRDDVPGLERMILSALPYVDEIVLGVDARSAPETVEMARRYADVVVEFTAADLGLTDEEWTANKIDFAKARNIGRARVTAPWTLVLDTDEYLIPGADDIRAKLRATDNAVGGLTPVVVLGASDFNDPQRLTRTQYRWEKGTHNQLRRDRGSAPIDFRIMCDTSLRTVSEASRRTQQRERGIDELIDEAGSGDLTALFHLAKHRAYGSDEDFANAVKLTEDYRLRIEPHSILADERAWLAIGLAVRYYQKDDLVEADRWACRALLDGPSCTAFCVLGDIAEDRGDLQQAHDWYVCACNVEDRSKIKFPGITDLRYGRLAGIKLALLDPEHAQQVRDAFIPSDG